ncbi:MAG TPA: peptide chain release factor N(5)-glutamine methyltransferase [Planctomycetota bacterium]|nr:peptide chain release factor N(5)-glutamine methyltransferase [Planctomycetota bacterium]
MNSRIQSVPPPPPPAPRIWTSLDLIKWTSDFFAKKGIESPRLEAELLLSEVLGVQRIRLYVDFEKPVPQEKLAVYREYVKRRAEKREPLQHIIGHAQFVDLTLKVSPAVLIPRPETELLAVWAVEKLLPKKAEPAEISAPPEAEKKTDGTPAETKNPEPPAPVALPPVRVLDLCTGSGCLALFIASKVPHAEVIATDISADALSVATENIAKLKLESRVTLKEGDLFAALATDPKSLFDLIVANPPYIDPAVRASLQPEVRDHEPAQALFADSGGLSVLQRIISGAAEWLKPGGWLGMEFGAGQAEALRKLAQESGGLEEISIKEDHRRLPRFLLARRKSCAL